MTMNLKNESESVIGAGLVAFMQEQLLKNGAIDTAGKSDGAILSELNDLIKQWVENGPVRMGTDYRTDLLSRAREAASREDWDIASLFYATWFEHWINYVLDYRSKLSERDRKKMLREVNLNSKFTWLLSLVHSKQICHEHLAAICKISELRNAYVHNKYNQVDVDQWDNEKKIVAKVVLKADETVEYLKQFEEELFFDDRMRHLVAKLRETRAVGLNEMKRVLGELGDDIQ